MTVLDENEQLNVSHSSSIILSELQWTDLSNEEIKTLNAMRRLYSDHSLLHHIDANHASNLLWNDIFNNDNEEYMAYSELLKNVYTKLKNKCDNDGNVLLDVQCLNINTEDSNDNSLIDQNENNPLVSILQSHSSNSNGLLLEKLNKFYLEHNAMNVDALNPEIIVRAKFDHGGFVKSLWMNITIELFSDHSLKHAIGIGPHSVIFINNKPVKLPQKYGLIKKTKMQSVENVNVNDQSMEDEEIMSTFDQLSKYDATEEFGIEIVRYEKGKVNQRHDFLKLTGALKEDIFDISVFVFGYNAQTNAPFIVHKRIGPDALPISAKRNLKKKKITVMDEQEEIDMTQLLKRKEFVLVTDSDEEQQTMKDLKMF